jgi:hypothetical protein
VVVEVVSYESQLGFFGHQVGTVEHISDSICWWDNLTPGV